MNFKFSKPNPIFSRKLTIINFSVNQHKEQVNQDTIKFIFALNTIKVE